MDSGCLLSKSTDFTQLKGCIGQEMGGRKMIQEEEVLRKAEEAGFDNCRILPAGELSFDHSLRKYCEVNY